jgi:hypothetical protein
MKKAIFKTSLIIVISIIAIGCRKNVVEIGPTLSFVADTGYISSDTAMACGDTAIIGLNCIWDGSDAIKTINTFMNDQQVGESYNVDESMNQGFTYEAKITKSLIPREKWEFEVIDSKGQISRSSLTLSIDSGGNITSVNALIGAQNYVSLGSYYDFTNQLNYFPTDAEANQALIDLLGGFDYTEKSFLASPASDDFIGAYDLSNWETKNATQFCETTLSVAQYNLVNKDNLLKSSFHPDKAVYILKGLNASDVYSFKTQNGRYGLIYIVSGAESESGYIIFDYKIQEQIIE